MRGITPPRARISPLSICISINYTDFYPNIFFSANVRKKPAVCSKFRESTKAIGNIKSVSPLSPNGLIVFF